MQPYRRATPPPASSRFCFSESGVAFSLQPHRSDTGRSSRQRRSAPETRPTRLLAGNEQQPLGCQDDASAVSKNGARVRCSPGERKKPEHIYRASVSHAASSYRHPSTPSTPCTSAAHTQHTQGTKEGADCAGRMMRRTKRSSRAKAVTHLAWKAPVLNSCMEVLTGSFQPPFDASG